MTDQPRCLVCFVPEALHGNLRHEFLARFGTLEQANSALERVCVEVYDWPAADFWHRDAILRAIRDA